MTNMVSTDINNLYQWMDLIVNNKEIKLTDNDASVNFYGTDGSVYLVINVYQSDKHSIEYYFKPAAENNGLSALVSVLESVGFSLSSLLSKIEKAEYKTCEMGDVFVFGEIEVFKESMSSN